MEAGKAADCHVYLAGHDIEQADAEQEYIQAELDGHPTWVALPADGWEYFLNAYAGTSSGAADVANA